MYFATYQGSKSETFSTYETLELAQERCLLHAQEHARVKGKYTIYHNVKSKDGLVFLTYKEERTVGNKKGKNIEW